MNDNCLKNNLTRLFTRLMKNRAWVLLILLAIAVRILAARPDWVEDYYSQGFYPLFSGLLRSLFGWIPLSIGDLFYGTILLIIFFKTGWLLRDLWRKKVDRIYLVTGLQQFLFLFLFLYVFFNVLWGLNYNRLGIAHQLGLQRDSATVEEIDTLAGRLLQKAIYYREKEEAGERTQLHRKRSLFSQSQLAYEAAANKYSFLSYQHRSVKPSIFSYAGNYLGFQGYYNPFSGEGQVNTTIPVFLQPFVTTHELAHQLGYAKESEANFVGYLACKEHPSAFFRYSVYLDMYLYAHAQLYYMDSVRAISLRKRAPAAMLRDIEELKQFYKAYQSPIEDIVTWGYDYFLQANQQPQGKRSYGQVTGWLLAWVRKNGWEAL